MGKIKKTLINRFEGGKAFDPREAQGNQFADSANFDTFQYPSTLFPVRGYETDEAYGGTGAGIKDAKIKTIGKESFGSTIYGIGTKTDGSGRKIYQKTPAATTWTATVSSGASGVESNTGSPTNAFFFETYSNNGSSVYWFSSYSTGTTWRYGYLQTISGPPTFNFDAFIPGSSRGFVPQPIIGQDGNGYVAHGNKIVRCNKEDYTFTDNIIVLGGQARFTSVCRYGSYLALSYWDGIKSFVGLWDYVDSQFTEVIDFGEGVIMVLENLDGVLVAVMDKYINSSVASGGNGTGSMQIKIWAGGAIQTISDVKAKATTADAFSQSKFTKNSILYWYAKIPTNSAGTEFLEGIWTFGRRTSGLGYQLSLHRTMPSATSSFMGVGDYQYFYGATGGDIHRTASTELYNLTSSYETVIFDDNNPNQEKQFIEAKVSFEKLTAGQTVLLKYRKNGDTSWTTVNPVPAIATGDVSADYPMEGNFRESQFRIESTGGAKITGFELTYEELD